MAALFTPAEANALYNKCKISYDPHSYSLRDGLKLTTDIGTMYKHHISCAGFGAEQQLVMAIHNYHKTSGTAYIKSAMHPPAAVDDECAVTWGIGPADTALGKKDDMYVSLAYLGDLGFDGRVLKSGRMLEAIVQTCVALSSPKSCCADLHWLTTEFAGDVYEDLHNFKRLTDALEAHAPIIPVYAHTAVPLGQCVPAVSVYTKHRGYLHPTGLDPKEKSHFTDHTVTVQMLATLYYFFEVLWAMHSLSDPKLVELVHVYAHRMPPVACSNIENVFFEGLGTGTVKLRDKVAEIIAIENPKARFEAYRKYAKTEDFEGIAVRNATDFLRGSPEALISAGFGTLVGFAQSYSNTWVRVNHCRILYEYAMTHKLLDEFDDSDELGEIDDGVTALSTAAGSAATTFSTATEKSSSDLMDLKIGSKSGVGGTPGATSYTSPTYEALDKAKAKYTDGRYEFKVEDRVDFSDTARKKYETIASKVSLVNRLLTQRIREIKTYNTGGKQAGLSSGRLDRKAVYRYKYDSNIFYNNTYKQLESDLAFGIILDISGSMHGKGIENGRITMIVLHETLKALGINHSIIGHTAHGRYTCDIERYQSFREDKTYHTRKNYALASLEAQNGNCDSASLFYMERALMRAKNPDKVCVIFSDGQPTECTGTDLREQVAHMERNGIKVIGIGIDFPEIADYYKDYANGKNLTDMLNIVTNILKEYILKKKERA